MRVTGGRSGDHDLGSLRVDPGDPNRRSAGHETDVLKALDIGGRTAPRTYVPLSRSRGSRTHRGAGTSEGRAYCTCIRGAALDLRCRHAGRGHRLRGGQAAGRQILGRHDLIETKGESNGWTQPACCSRRPSSATTARRAGTRPIGSAWRRSRCRCRRPRSSAGAQLAYYDPPARKGGKPRLVGHHPCVVFETVAPDGRRHAHRIYVALDGRRQGRARRRPRRPTARPEEVGAPEGGPERRRLRRALGRPGDGTAPAGRGRHRDRRPRSRSRTRPRSRPASSRSPRPCRRSGIRAFVPWPATRRITIAADRDEDRPPDDRGYQGRRAGSPRLRPRAP